MIERPVLAMMLGAVLSFATLVPMARADTLIFAADPWCPYNCDPRDAAPGYAVEIAREAFAAAGHKAEYQVMPWKRALALVASGEVHGVIGAGGDETAGLVIGTEPVGVSRDGLAYRRAGNFVYKNPQSLSSMKIGKVLAYDFDPPLEAVITDHAKGVLEVGGVNALEELLGSVVRSRVDVALDDENVLKAKIKEMGLGAELAVAETPYVTPIYIAFSPEWPASPDYARTLDDGIRALRKSGKLDKILAKYGLDDWEKR